MTIFYVTKDAGASDSNGGTSLAVRSTGTDGISDATAGTTKLTSFSAAGQWSAGDIGHGIFASSSSRYRKITAFQPGGVLGTIGTTNLSATITSAGLFTAAMVGQGISGANIQANTVITAVANANSATISILATGTGSVTATLAPMFTTSGNNAFIAATGQTWNVGGPWASMGTIFAATSAVVGGDTVYIAPGRYRETISMANTEFTSAVDIIGDIDGSHTDGVGGEVALVGYPRTDLATAGAVLINFANRDYCRFTSICFYSAANTMFTNLTTGALNTQFIKCALANQAAGIAITAGTIPFGTTLNHLYDRCIFFAVAGFTYTPTTAAAGGDYDLNVVYRNCLVICNGQTFITLGAAGALAFKGGGVDVESCTFIGAASVLNVANANVSTSIPCTFYNNFVLSATAVSPLQATSAGQIVEDYNVWASSSGTIDAEVTQGGHSASNVGVFPNALFCFGQEAIWGGAPRLIGTPMRDSILSGWGNTSSPVPPTVDLLDRPRPSGVGRLVKTGTATSATATTLTDTGGGFGPVGTLGGGAVCRITGGTGSGQSKIIKTHTNTVLTFYGNWQTTPDATSTYAIYYGAPSDSYAPTSATATVITVSNASWDASMWAGFTLEVTAGTGSGQTTTVTSNTATALTVPTMATPLDTTSRFKLYRKTSETAINNTVGALERADIAVKETTVTDTGGVGWVINGYGCQELKVPVIASLTTIGVRARYDANHGTTTKPQVEIVANPTVGVTAETVTMTAAADTWETVELTSFTPTAPGVVTVRLRARPAALTGKAYFDTVSVT